MFNACNCSMKTPGVKRWCSNGSLHPYITVDAFDLHLFQLEEADPLDLVESAEEHLRLGELSNALVRKIPSVLNSPTLINSAPPPPTTTSALLRAELFDSLSLEFLSPKAPPAYRTIDCLSCEYVSYVPLFNLATCS